MDDINNYLEFINKTKIKISAESIQTNIFKNNTVYINLKFGLFTIIEKSQVFRTRTMFNDTHYGEKSTPSH